MQPEISESLTDSEHILADIHEIAKNLHEFRQLFDAKVSEWEEIARPFARIRQAGKLGRLGKGVRDAVPQDQLRQVQEP